MSTIIEDDCVRDSRDEEGKTKERDSSKSTTYAQDYLVSMLGTRTVDLEDL